MVDVEFRYEIDGQAFSEPPNQYDLEMVFEHTRLLTQQQVQNKLGRLVCAEHGRPPRVTVTAAYSTETEQIELGYHVDSCCQLLLLEAVRSLNR
jgi:hypothetical protein